MNRNYPLPENADEKLYHDAFSRAVETVSRFKPGFLVVSLGFDILKGDQTGAFLLRANAMNWMGKGIAELGLPTIVVQEGGYNLRNLKQGVRAFFDGLATLLAERFP